MRPGVTAVIPSIPPRRGLLATRALPSVLAQTRPVDAISVVVDRAHAGATATRDAALAAVGTEWTAFLDDDDEWLPEHVELLLGAAGGVGADYVYAWPETVGGTNPHEHWFGVPWDDTQPHDTTITVLVRTELAQAVGFSGPHGGEDLRFALGCLAAGARIVHLPVRTWRWHHHPRNTSGRPDRW
ncbi:glycosyltransferase family 2 protein [Parafrankia sp. FMc2]|uniref:glycosyltransferase family 2 protein n=1 Tax=Parafrankia sp. FMc2 TaxID=3233196 RepID=UPI0034D50712